MPNRNYLEILEEIKQQLEEAGFLDQAVKLDSEIKNSFTCTEICMKCGSLLLKLQNDLMLSKDVSNLIYEFTDYCNSIGIIIKLK